MRHLKAGRKLGRTGTHRLALVRNLAASLFEYEWITTTKEKAKEVARFAEKVITLGKKGTLTHRRRAASRLQNEEMVGKVFADIAGRFADRPGGYTRIIKLPRRRLSDGATMVRIELTEISDEASKRAEKKKS
ncbi:MAG: 50S ribosomal protein L17 [Phycisphaerae bacterium]|jgi:large subunit ribosomal protein L17|nr:50S ribosomal protein L17 [Phycisphaerae bacterium]